MNQDPSTPDLDTNFHRLCFKLFTWFNIRISWHVPIINCLKVPKWGIYQVANNVFLYLTTMCAYTWNAPTMVHKHHFKTFLFRLQGLPRTVIIILHQTTTMRSSTNLSWEWPEGSILWEFTQQGPTSSGSRLSTQMDLQPAQASFVPNIVHATMDPNDIKMAS